MPLTPTVAIVGRPNVGKSTLFNRLVGRRQAIVHDRPGVTRDRITALAELAPGRTVQFVDTGGLVLGDDPLGLGRQVLAAVEESDLLLLVVDGREGPVPADQEVWERLRATGEVPLSIAARHFTKAEMEAAEYSFELERRRETLLNLDLRQMGVGGIDSWTRLAWPMEAYRIPPDQPYALRYTLTPVVPAAR